MAMIHVTLIGDLSELKRETKVCNGIIVAHRFLLTSIFCSSDVMA